MPPGMALIVTLRGSNYRCLEQIFMVLKGLSHRSSTVHVYGHQSTHTIFRWVNRFSMVLSLKAMKILTKLIKVLTALLGRLSLGVGGKNGPEWELKTVLFNPPLKFSKQCRL